MRRRPLGFLVLEWAGFVPFLVTGALLSALLPGYGFLAAQEVQLAKASLPMGKGVDPKAPKAKEMVVQRVGSGLIRLDGRLDESPWSEAIFRSDLQQKGKDMGFDPRVETEVAFLFDDEALYVGARMETDPGSQPRAILGQRDEVGNSERILISLDTYRDQQTAYTFGVTVAGVRVDHVQARDNEGWADQSFDPVWEARVSRDSAGWSAEMRIPFSQLRFTPGDQQVWGLNVRRWNPATFLNLYWVVVPYYETGWASRFGTLSGLSGISGGAGMEVTPYILGRASFLDESLGSPDPTTRARVGGDMKVGLGSNLTLDATINPDFGQVEADPARVNLTAFETFFPERRPFFLEGRELFRTRGPNWFYSRRVGSAPPTAAGGGLFEKVENATILGGAKITGRLPSGASIAALGAITDREGVPVSGESGGETLEVAPRTVFAVGRFQQEVGPSGSYVGLMGTLVNRTLSEGSWLARTLPRQAMTGGVDFVKRFGAGEYEISGFGGGSKVTGTQDAMWLLQLSSAHYYQRPDATHVEFDPEPSSLTGWGAGLKAGKMGGAPWTWDAEVSASSPGFEIRDAGSQKRSDRIDVRVGAQYGVRDSKGAVRNRSVGLGISSGWNFGGVRRALSPSAFMSATLGNLWNTSLEVGMNVRSLSDDLTRGGPLMGTPRSLWGNFQLSSGNSNRAWWSGEASGFKDEAGGWSASFSGGVSVLPQRWLEVSVFAGGSSGDDSRQFLAAMDGGPAETFGTRYVFSFLERKEFFAQVRTKLAFAPDAVLTLYAEPFISSGKAHDFGELTAAKAQDLRVYGTDGTSISRLDDGAHEVIDGEEVLRIENYDFWVRSFRSSAVFRWEWRGGSSVYLIWQKNLWSFLDRSRPTGADVFFQSVRDPGEDILVAKVSFLLG